MELCKECTDYINLNGVRRNGTNKKMYSNFRNDYYPLLVIFRADSIVCDKCGNHVSAKVYDNKEHYYIEPHSGLKNATLTVIPSKHKVSNVYPNTQFMICANLGNILFVITHNIVVYFDTGVTYGSRVHFILNDGRLIQLFADKDTDKIIIIDEYGESVPYNLMSYVAPNTFEDEKHWVVITDETQHLK